MSKESHKLTLLSGWISIIGNILLFIVKLWAGLVTGSVALIADAWHTLSDSASSLVVIISANFSIKPADKEHPFGHGRIELISSIIIGVMLAFVAFDFFIQAIDKLRHRETVVFGTFAIVATVLSIIVKEAMAQYAIWASKKVDSPMLRADAWHHRSDALSSVIILIGIFLAPFWWWIDGVLGIVVSLFIIHTTITLFKENINPLLGEEPDKAMINSIHQICDDQFEQHVNAHHFHLHRYGRHKELTFHIRLPGNMDLQNAHKIASTIERSVEKNLNVIATIHMEPMESKK